MGILLRSLVAAAVLSGCGGHSFRMRVIHPAGASLQVLGGPFSGEETLAIPFVAAFQPMGGWQHYDVRLRLPAEVSTRLGGSGEAELSGTLHVYPATPLARNAIAELPIDEERLGRLLRGELGEASWWVYDPNDRDGRLAHLTLHAH